MNSGRLSSLSNVGVVFLLMAALSGLIAAMPNAVADPPNDNDRMDWWREARFGMFIHWGLYAIPAGEWNGSTNHAEWIRHSAQIPIEEYDRFVDQFNPVKFDAEGWVRLAKDAGMKYIVITSKHHDGFCLFDSQYTNASPFANLPWGRCTTKRVGQNTKLYFHVFDWPADGRLIVPGLGNEFKQAGLLAQPDRELAVERHESDVWVRVPASAPDEVCSVVALEIVGQPIVYQLPQIVAAAECLVHPLDVTFEVTSPELEIRYTLDGSDPTGDSPKYERPLMLTESTTVKACSFHRGQAVSGVAVRSFTKVTPLPAVDVAGLSAGLVCEIFTGNWSALPKFDTLEPVQTRTVVNVSPHAARGDEHFGRWINGYITIPRDDVYKFALTSDDGSRLTVDGTTVVDNDGLHGPQQKCGVIALAAGAHTITIEYFNKTGGASLTLKLAPAGKVPERVPDSAFRH